ncbi:MAG TPA: ArsA family ATPase [Acidimicrobiales bacterium]
MSGRLLDRRLLFVTGKGGVGKTTVSAALALLAARSGKQVLVCEVDAKGTLGAALEVGPLRFEPTPVESGLVAMAMNTEDSLREYLTLQLKLPLLARIGPLARMLDFVASAAPGVREILTVGKPTWEVREQHYDLVVVDAVATGHITGQLAAPQAINELVQVGIVREQTRWMLDILGDPESTGLVIVTSPEEMPVNETIELAARLPRESPVELAAVVVNRVLPELFGRGEEAVFDQLKGSPAAVTRLREAAGTGVTTVLAAADLAVTLRRSRATHLAQLRAALPPGLPLLYVPELFSRIPGRRFTAQVAEALGEELT